MLFVLMDLRTTYKNFSFLLFKHLTSHQLRILTLIYLVNINYKLSIKKKSRHFYLHFEDDEYVKTELSNHL